MEEDICIYTVTSNNILLAETPRKEDECIFLGAIFSVSGIFQPMNSSGTTRFAAGTSYYKKRNPVPYGIFTSDRRHEIPGHKSAYRL